MRFSNQVIFGKPQNNIENWKTWQPKNEYEFYVFEITKLYISGVISTEECNKKLEKAKEIFEVIKEKNYGQNA